ncbi:hypothetical protein TSAR_003897 [Trichomalopsis sarcophagae]|uniref:Uncharacterized protein n=1 Tax=Trichomalopsis sarcophagae TaxID=543379 RepID=A0A232EZR9_9HYME|nr:hypothetical protein TSAR_003897 [Trichomalopsis sarcophagae]
MNDLLHLFHLHASKPLQLPEYWRDLVQLGLFEYHASSLHKNSHNHPYAPRWASIVMSEMFRAAGFKRESKKEKRDPALQGPRTQSQANRVTAQSRQTRAVFSPYSLKLEKAINKPHHVHENGEDFTEHSSLTTSTKTGRIPKFSSSHTREREGNKHTSTRAMSHRHQGTLIDDIITIIVLPNFTYTVYAECFKQISGEDS